MRVSRAQDEPSRPMLLDAREYDCTIRLQTVIKDSDD